MSVFLTCVLIFSALAVALTFIDLGGEIIRRFRSRRKKGFMMALKSAPQRRSGGDDDERQVKHE
jgi:hypothetical protein